MNLNVKCTAIKLKDKKRGKKSLGFGGRQGTLRIDNKRIVSIQT
jgi:hypothetical protein